MYIKSQTIDGDNIVHKVEVDISKFDSECVSHPKLDTEVQDEPLDRIFVTPVEVENSIVKISNNFLAEQITKCQPSIDALDHHVLKEKSVVSMEDILLKFRMKLHR